MHAAVLALLALTDNCELQEMLDELIQLDILSLLSKQINNGSNPEGLRMSCATVARNIIGRTKQYKLEFINTNGIKGLVSLLDFDSKRVTDEQYCQWLLERVNDVRDYLDAEGGKADEVVAKKLVAAGVKAKLEKLKESRDNDIIEDSADVLQLLSAF